MSYNSSSELSRLEEIMKALRHPETGCPWDIKQNFSSIAPYTIEEAYEVDDAIRRDDMDDLKNELGDLLFQVIFHAQIAVEKDLFDLADVINGICEKMVRRHPHVFSNATASEDEDIKQQWEDIKADERRTKNAGSVASLMDDIPKALPALNRAIKIQKRASRIGFDWQDAAPIFAKLDEEIEELKSALKDGSDFTHITEEVGDILFVISNLARKLKVDPEAALRLTNEKFMRRFRWMEAQGELAELDLDAQELLWQTAKQNV